MQFCVVNFNYGNFLLYVNGKNWNRNLQLRQFQCWTESSVVRLEKFPVDSFNQNKTKSSVIKKRKCKRNDLICKLKYQQKQTEQTQLGVQKALWKTENENTKKV